VEYVYTASRMRFIDLFSLKCKSYFEVFNDERSTIQTVAGKMSIRKCNTSLEGIGYVMNEDEFGQQLEVLMEDDTRVVFPIGPKLIVDS
jgi:hypothetical protein